MKALTLAIVLAAVFAGCAATRPVLPESEEVAGIAGEPIPLDSPKLDPKYKDYLARVRQMIKEKWADPCVKEKSGSSVNGATTRPWNSSSTLASSGMAAFPT